MKAKVFDGKELKEVDVTTTCTEDLVELQEATFVYLYEAKKEGHQDEVTKLGLDSLFYTISERLGEDTASLIMADMTSTVHINAHAGL